MDVFCAGADLTEVAAGRGKTLNTPDGGFAGFVHSKRRKPWIAAVAGAVLAGGCELSLACDMIVAGETSRFGLPEVKRGIFAGAGGVHRLPRALPRAVALEMIATGDPIDAARAYALGMINRLAPAEGVLEAAKSLARAIAVNAPISVVESLAIAREAQQATDEAMRARCAEVGARVLASADAKEGPRAFVEKREPVWKGE
jgi:enoyl-CoA hydratase